MARVDKRDKLEADGGLPERGYADWKHGKIVRGLAQSRDRAVMIPAERILRMFAS